MYVQACFAYGGGRNILRKSQGPFFRTWEYSFRLFSVFANLHCWGKLKSLGGVYVSHDSFNCFVLGISGFLFFLLGFHVFPFYPTSTLLWLRVDGRQPPKGGPRRVRGSSNSIPPRRPMVHQHQHVLNMHTCYPLGVSRRLPLSRRGC